MTDQLDRLKDALSDRYSVERELGRGGMATVYLAHDLKHDRQVAIKVLRPDLAAALGPERFHREIKIAAQLQHPNILPLHDSGEADGLLYYVMPYVEGQSLRDKLAREGELPIGDAVRLLRDVVDALTEDAGLAGKSVDLCSNSHPWQYSPCQLIICGSARQLWNNSATNTRPVSTGCLTTLAPTSIVT